MPEGEIWLFLGGGGIDKMVVLEPLFPQSIFLKIHFVKTSKRTNLPSLLCSVGLLAHYHQPTKEASLFLKTQVLLFWAS